MGGGHDPNAMTGLQQSNNNLNGIPGMQPQGMGNFDLNSMVANDLWRMPMTLEWDWADMTGYSGYEDPISMSGVLPEFSSQSGHGTSGGDFGGGMSRGR